MMSAAETVAVTVTVLAIERLAAAGRLLALAEVAVEIEGIEFVLRGVRVVDERGGRLGIEAPFFRHNGLPRAAVDLPPELSATIADEVTAAYRLPVWRN